MSSNPCACEPVVVPQPHAVHSRETAPSFDFGFDAGPALVPVSDGSFQLVLALVTAVVPLALAHQRRNSWCVLSLRPSGPASPPADPPRRSAAGWSRRFAEPGWVRADALA